MAPQPTSTPTRPQTNSPWGGGGTTYRVEEPEALSAGDITAQMAEADALLAELTAGNEKMAELLEQVETLSEEANAALEAKSEADEEAQAATSRAATARTTAERIEAERVRKQQQLRDWAFSAYADGGTTAEMVSVFDAMMNSPEKAGNPVGDLTYLTEERVRLFDDIRLLTERKARAAAAAEAESKKAEEAAKEAAEAKKRADAALKKQEEVVAAAAEDQMTTLQDAAPLAMMLVGMVSPEAQERGEAILAALIENNIEIPDIEKPCSSDRAIYPNGQLPASALCPLWGAPGDVARPDAARAFNALSQRYAQVFGQPICVTDSYRSFNQQVAVKASRGFWAATPGTSNHGLGMALDLCGGINSFGTIEHRWMRQNAPMYGWFHPSWAAAGGRKPEPWHWEYAG